MAKELGFFNKDQEKALAKLLDDALKFKGIMEFVDGYFAKAFVRLVDDNLAQKQLIDRFNIEQSVVDKVGAVADSVVAKDWDKATEQGAEVLNEIIDIPGLSEDAEGEMFEGALKMIHGAIKLKREGKLAEN